MTTEAGKLAIVTKIDFSKLQSQLKKVTRVVAAAAKKMARAFAGVARGLTKALLGITALFAGIVVLSVRAAMKQQDALFGLKAALNNTGDATTRNMKKFKIFAASIQEVTKFGDEEILALMAMQKNLGVTTDRLQEAAKMTIGLSAATGMNAESTARYVALALQGEFTMLRKYIPALRMTTDKTEQLAIVTRFAANGFKIAEAQADTTSGALKQMWNVLGDLAEAFGAPLLGPIKRAAKAMKEFLKGAIEKVEEFTEKLSTVISMSIEEKGLFATLRKLVVDIFKAVGILTVAWSKNLFDLLIPVFEQLGFIIGNAITSALPKSVRGVTAQDKKQEREVEEQRIRDIRENSLKVAKKQIEDLEAKQNARKELAARGGQPKKGRGALLLTPRIPRIDPAVDSRIAALKILFNMQLEAWQSGDEERIAIFDKHEKIVIEKHRANIAKLDKEISDLTPTFTSFETQMEKIKARTKEANAELSEIFAPKLAHRFLAIPKDILGVLPKLNEEIDRMAKAGTPFQFGTDAFPVSKDTSLNSINQARGSAFQSESRRLFTGARGGQLVAATASELFGTGKPTISEGEKLIVREVRGVKDAIIAQPITTDKLRKIDTNPGPLDNELFQPF